ncbi:uncharacterized protein LOC142164742 [Nicotiana tabacum]|uniref:Uncharacterized protein LOC142164742 n=1 Tax=Nicotiana tabacum TaxID=4097 RepID=A0AC58S2Y2_TOBAC
MVTSWILNSLSKEIADNVEYGNDAVELWKELEDCYEQTKGIRLYQIQKEINDLSQGTLDITTYYTKLKKLWEELTTLNKRIQCSCTCNYGANESMYKAEQDRRLIQFLMGLNEDEKREIRLVSQLSVESTSMNVSTLGQGTFKANFPTHNNYSGIPRNRLICEYFRKPGHSKDRYNKGKRVVAAVQVPNEAVTTKENENKTQDDGRNMNLTEEQYECKAPWKFLLKNQNFVMPR